MSSSHSSGPRAPSARPESRELHAELGGLRRSVDPGLEVVEAFVEHRGRARRSPTPVGRGARAPAPVRPIRRCPARGEPVLEPGFVEAGDRPFEHRSRDSCRRTDREQVMHHPLGPRWKRAGDGEESSFDAVPMSGCAATYRAMSAWSVRSRRHRSAAALRSASRAVLAAAGRLRSPLPRRCGGASLSPNICVVDQLDGEPRRSCDRGARAASHCRRDSHRTLQCPMLGRVELGVLLRRHHAPLDRGGARLAAVIAPTYSEKLSGVITFGKTSPTLPRAPDAVLFGIGRSGRTGSIGRRGRAAAVAHTPSASRRSTSALGRTLRSRSMIPNATS